MFCRISLIVAAILVGSQSAAAQFNYVRNDQAICELFGCHSKLSAWGTCVAVAHWNGGTVFLSAGHNFEPETPKHKIVQISIGGAAATLRRAWFEDPEHPRIDFAVLFLPTRHADLITLASTPPEPGDDVTVSGFVFDDTARPRVVHLSGKVSSVNSGEHGIVDFEFPQGTSGGPVTRRGELVGLALHRRNIRRHSRDVAGIQVNYDFKKSVLSLFPGATFAQAPPPPASNEDFKPADQVLDRPAPPPREIPDRQEGAGGKDAGPAIKPVPDPTVPKTEPDPINEESLIQKLLVHPELLEKITNAAGVAAPAVEAAGDAATSDWASTAIKAAATATFGPPGAIGATVLTGVGGWLWNRRRKRKQQEAADAEKRRQNVTETLIENTEQLASEGETLKKEGEALRRLVEASKQIVPIEAPSDKTDETAELREQIAGLVEYLKERDVSPETVPGVTAEQVIDEDGSVTLGYFLDGIRLLKSNELSVPVLGHKQAVKAIEDYVYERAAAQTGSHLNSTKRS